MIAAAKQDRLSTNETATDGYTLLRLYGSYSFDSGGAVHTITARLDNVTNELYRNHLSLIKDLVPEMGRNFKVVYSVRLLDRSLDSSSPSACATFPMVKVSDSFGICVTMGRMIQASAKGTSRVSVSDSH